jgi:hypothetical protein
MTSDTTPDDPPSHLPPTDTPPTILPPPSPDPDPPPPNYDDDMILPPAGCCTSLEIPSLPMDPLPFDPGLLHLSALESLESMLDTPPSIDDSVVHISGTPQVCGILGNKRRFTTRVDKDSGLLTLALIFASLTTFLCLWTSNAAHHSPLNRRHLTEHQMRHAYVPIRASFHSPFPTDLHIIKHVSTTSTHRIPSYHPRPSSMVVADSSRLGS